MVQILKKFDLCEIYLVSDILTNFHKDPIIRSTKNYRLQIPVIDNQIL